MDVRIRDDLDLVKIVESGQCFRAAEVYPGLFRFVSKENILYIKKLTTDIFEVSCTCDVWERFWVRYFDLGRNYAEIREKLSCQGGFVKEAVESGAGLRILRQDSFETLISFILSQRKNIPAIRQSIEKLCECCGTQVTTVYETLYLFPTPVQLASLGEAVLRQCGLGYRAAYVQDAVRKAGEGFLNGLDELDTELLLQKLQEIHGVGVKVAGCSALFGYGRTDIAPVDTWIRQIIDKRFGGKNPFAPYGEYAGILQQYFFYYAIHNKISLKT